jgi:hypothetical protein
MPLEPRDWRRFGVRCITEVITGKSRVTTVQRYVSARTLEDGRSTGKWKSQCLSRSRSRGSVSPAKNLVSKSLGRAAAAPPVPGERLKLYAQRTAAERPWGDPPLAGHGLLRPWRYLPRHSLKLKSIRCRLTLRSARATLRPDKGFGRLRHPAVFRGSQKIKLTPAPHSWFVL